MDVREKLVELLSQIQSYGVKQGSHVTHKEGKTNREIASYLIAHGVTVQEWISVKDRLPEDASTVLAIDSDGTISSAYYVGRWHSGGDLDEDAVIHWMPLPQPPKGE